MTVMGLIYTSLSISTNENIVLKKKNEIFSMIYRLSLDENYHYEFRYEMNNPNHRLMLVIPGGNRMCVDLWDFPVGRRILTIIRQFGYSILAICPLRKTFDIDLPLKENKDVQFIYLSLQKWINRVYYSRFKRYPLLYIHATSRGSRFAGILCRILPIQGQLLFIYPGHREMMLIPSSYQFNLQRRLSLDSTFANWFYFDFCYNQYSTDRILCPFHNNQSYFSPVPPTFFIYLKDDPFQQEISYRYFIEEIRRDSMRLGGILLNHFQALQLDIILPIKINTSYMQENFFPWYSQPHFSQLFYEHLSNPEKYQAIHQHRETCGCSRIDFKFYENLLHILISWPAKKRKEYEDYARSIDRYRNAFCEELCGDILTRHSMVSRNIHKTLLWLDQIDQIRRSLYLNDYLQRPLRIWMYNKSLLFTSPNEHFFPKKIQWNRLAKEYQMYSPEYFLQDYFQWTNEPLLADYYIIPCDLMYFYFYHQPSRLNHSQFEELIGQLNENYFHRIFKTIRTRFPYWRLANGVDQYGTNHLLPILGGRNMGILTQKLQNTLKNVIQLSFTGIRENTHWTSPYTYRNRSIVYRHHYDILLPQYTRLKIKQRISDDLDGFIEKKTRVFFFAGELNHGTSFYAARSQLNLLWQYFQNNERRNRTWRIADRLFEILSVRSGHIEPLKYIQSIESTVFSLCPEGFLPWSPRLYESIQIGAIPLILADNIVLPFERWINWRSFTVKINVSNLLNLTEIINRIDQHFYQFIREKLQHALPYFHAFQWPYVLEYEDGEHRYRYQNHSNEQSENVFYYLSLELRCRRLEQWYGLTFNTSTQHSIQAQQLSCTNHPTICPCHQENRSLAFEEYL